MRDFDLLDEYLAEHAVDGYLIHESGEDPNQRYLSGFGSPDPFVSLWTGGELHVLVRGLDRGLARAETDATTVASGAQYGHQALIEEHGRAEAEVHVLQAFLADHDVASVAVPQRFPLGIADGLRTLDIDVQLEDEGVLEVLRAVKSPAEIESIDAVQQATERAMARAEAVLENASVDDGILVDAEGPITSERLKAEIEISLLHDGCALEETIVASGPDAGDPHHRGRGPIEADAPIVIDIFPRDRETKYHADMTRTLCVGTPSDTIQEWYDVTDEALDAALACIGPGVGGDTVHDAVCEVYEAAGIPTLRSDESTETGFIHSTGHGVGLAVHERPTLSQHGEALEPGHVVTVEPGVYDPAIGGVRIEDLVVITPDGYENLTEYHKQFVV